MTEKMKNEKREAKNKNNRTAEILENLRFRTPPLFTVPTL